MSLNTTFRGAGRRSGPSVLLLIPALLVGIGTCLPVFWLVMRALEADPAELSAIVFRQRNLLLMLNTMKLVAVVLAIGTAIALPAAWLVTRSDLRGRGVVSFLMAMPLAVPGYVMAYAIIGMSGYYGFAKHWFGITLPPLRGLWGAGLALSLYTFPYLFLNLRSAFLGMDPALEETARSLGQSRASIFRHVMLPQLWPALVASWLVVGLYVIGDFGAIALMRYEVFSYAIYTQYSGAFDRTYAAWLSLMLLAVTVAALFAQHAVTRNRRFSRTGTGSARKAQPMPLGRMRVLAWGFVALVVIASLGMPLLVLAHWMRLGLPQMDWGHLGQTALATLGTAGPAAFLTVLLAVPVVLLILRHPGPLATVIDRLAYLGYATPPLAFALAMVFFALQAVPFFYQSYAILIFAYVMSFLALAFGPIRMGLLQIGARQEEAARSLGATPLRSFASVVMPRLRRPFVAGGLLVFIMVVKELPITLILAPTGYTTLSMNVFGRTNEGMMAEAAPFALSIILFSSLFVGLFLKYESKSDRQKAESSPR
ncbi:iron ABC transporter permease [Paracoccus caeni]|uniref:Iron ABC transporter permease n=1 Tax=Paracoccus caeni TaxID=657651 RepID=A0A934SIR6_9RHOB|nr:iron ABC transporter permease [Paracoccus caeni]MBK4216097.1 iron ABC transporter permease [Paracoccus caeni]